MAMNKARARGTVLLFVAAATILAAVHWHARAPASRLVPQGERKAVPPLQLNLQDGSQWTLADQRGKIVLINYWATWCAPCQEEMPALNRIAQEESSAGVVVLGVSVDTGDGSAERVRDFVMRYRVTYPVAFGATTMTSASDTIGIPNTLLVDRRGRLAKVYAGPIRGSDVVDDLRVLGREP